MSGQFNKTVNLIVLGSCWLDMMSCYLMMKLKLMIMISWGIRRVAGGWLVCFCVVCCGQLVVGYDILLLDDETKADDNEAEAQVGE